VGEISIYMEEIDTDFLEYDKFIAKILTENTYLRKVKN
jgi:hypothetical protein